MNISNGNQIEDINPDNNRQLNPKIAHNIVEKKTGTTTY